MADITARLIWYRLNELYNTTSVQLTGLDLKQVDILDFIFVGWCLLGIFATLIINYVYDWVNPREPPPQKHLRESASAGQLVSSPPAKNGPLTSIRELPESRQTLRQLSSPADEDAETCIWLNTVVTWLFQNSDGSSALLEAWLSALNYALSKEKRCNGRTLVFESIQVGQRPPEVVWVRGAHTSDVHNMELLLELRASEVKLKVRLSDQEVCDVRLMDIEAQVSADLRLCPEGFKGSLRLVERPRLKSEVRPALLKQQQQQQAALSSAFSANSVSWIADEVTNAITQAVTEVFLSDGDRGGSGGGGGATRLSTCSGVYSVAGVSSVPADTRDAACQTAGLPPTPPGVPVASAAKKQSSKAASESAGIQQALPQSAAADGPVRLLVKLIKATGLAPRAGFGASVPSIPQNPYACVELDEPYQRHVTGSVYGSSNPYWDQHYMLDLTHRSNRLSLHVFDRSGQSDVLLGSAALLLADLPAQGARVIQPLRLPRRDSTSTPLTSGQQPPTLTAEFLFVTAAKAASFAGGATLPLRFTGPRVASSESLTSAAESPSTQAGASAAASSSPRPGGRKAASTEGILDQTGQQIMQQGRQDNPMPTNVRRQTSLPKSVHFSEPVLSQTAGCLESEEPEFPYVAGDPTDPPDLSLSQTVDDFMKSADVSYQPMSSTDRPSSGYAKPDVELSHKRQESLGVQPGENLTGNLANSQSARSSETAALTMERQRGSLGNALSAAAELDYTQSMPMLNMMQVEDEGGASKAKHTKSRGHQPRSFVSRVRRVFRGPSSKTHQPGSGSKIGHHQPPSSMTADAAYQSRSSVRASSVDQDVFLPTTPSGDSAVFGGIPDIYPDTPDSELVLSGSETGQGTMEKDRKQGRSKTGRSLSSSIRRLFGSGRKNKRNRADSDSKSSQTRDQHPAVWTGQGRSAWNSEDVL